MGGTGAGHVGCHESPGSLERIEIRCAWYLMEGLPGVQSLVRTWGARQPRAWLFWIWLLVGEDDWPAVAAVGEEALSVVEDRQFRALIAEKLLDAGAEISRPDLVLKGRREVFCSVPGGKLLCFN